MLKLSVIVVKVNSTTNIQSFLSIESKAPSLTKGQETRMPERITDPAH